MAVAIGVIVALLGAAGLASSERLLAGYFRYWGRAIEDQSALGRAYGRLLVVIACFCVVGFGIWIAVTGG